MHIHEPTRGHWPTVPFGAWRLWDSQVTWPDLEPRRGEWHLDLLKQYLDIAEQHHVEVLLTLGMTPTWAASRPSENSTHGLGGASTPRDLRAWENYISIIATLGRGRIRAYEIWNEPNWPHFYSGTVEQMLELARVAYSTIKKIDPSAIVVTPAVAMPGHGAQWLEKYLAAGGGNFADVIGVHFYVEGASDPEAMLAEIAQVKQLRVRYGLENKPIWNTETGWSKPKQFKSEEEAAAFVVRAYLLNWAAGVERFYWYAWDNRHWVTLYLTQSDRTTPTLAANAYGTVEGWLLGATVTGCDSQHDGSWICVLQTNSGKSSRVLWNPTTTENITIPKSWHAATVIDLRGETTRLGTALRVGPSPVLLE